MIYRFLRGADEYSIMNFYGCERAIANSSCIDGKMCCFHGKFDTLVHPQNGFIFVLKCLMNFSRRNLYGHCSHFHARLNAHASTSIPTHDRFLQEQL